MFTKYSNPNLVNRSLCSITIFVKSPSFNSFTSLDLLSFIPDPNSLTILCILYPLAKQYNFSLSTWLSKLFLLIVEETLA